MSTAHRIELFAPVPIELAAEVSRRILYVSSGVAAFTLICNDVAVLAVDVVLTAPNEGLADVARKINAVVDDEVRPQLVTPKTVVWTSVADMSSQSGVFDELLASGAATVAGEGQVALGEPMIGLFRYLDATLTALVASLFAVREYRYPTLISTVALQRARYLSAFPHHLFFVTRLHNDLDVYRAVREAVGDGEVGSGVLAACRNVDYCLPPTMCYHTFEQHRGTVRGGQGLEVITARGKSFRFEAGYVGKLERLWDFTIREIVFFGTRDEVLVARKTVMSAVFALMNDLGLAGYCEVGNDPFFGTDTAERIGSQRMLELKYELRLGVEDDRTVAVGSFNFHNDLFGRQFDIQHAGGGPIQSGCVGFGLERLAYAFVCRHGVNPQHWPPAVPRS